MKKLTLAEVLDRLEKDGITMSKRTFDFYQRKGLLPRPSSKAIGVEGRGVYGYFDESVVALVHKIDGLKQSGLSLRQIENTLFAQVFEMFRSIVQRWNFPEHLEVRILAESYTPEESSLSERLNEDTAGEYDELKLLFSLFRRQVVNDLRGDLKPWWPEETLELYILEKAVIEIISILKGLSLAEERLRGRIFIEKKEKEIENKEAVIIKHWGADLTILAVKVFARMAEITGEYGGQNHGYVESVFARYKLLFT